jgi:hypothetical protein
MWRYSVGNRERERKKDRQTDRQTEGGGGYREENEVEVGPVKCFAVS